MNQTQRELARHALGLDAANRSYRNRYFATQGSAEDKEWAAMAESELALRVPEHDTQTTNFYCLTKVGAEMALGERDSLDPEDFGGHGEP